MDSDDWALMRMVELRQAGEEARFVLRWRTRGERREYRLEIRRANGVIERPIYPLPIGGLSAEVPVEVESEQPCPRCAKRYECGNCRPCPCTETD